MSRALNKLKSQGILSYEDARNLAPVAGRYAVAVSDYLIDKINNINDPVARQYVPDIRELETASEELTDPIGDATHSPVKGIVHRYPNRALLLPLERCAVYCRFCFRREKVGQDGHGLLSARELGIALDYLKTTEAIREVILTGGDPFILSVRRLQSILGTLEIINHINIIRFHTRVPVADPVRVSDELCDTLRRCTKPVYVVIHVNHAMELDAKTDAAFLKLRRAGCILLSQSVLLKDINNNVEALAALFQSLAERGVKPYYLHHPDLASGTSHFRVGIEEGQALMKSLRCRISGLAMPAYVLDIPGGFGKVPVSLCSIHRKKNKEESCQIEDIYGVLHDYPV